MSAIDPRCAAFEDDLSALLDGELDTPRADAVRTHAETCAACTRRFVALRAVDSALADIAAAPSPTEVVRLAALQARLVDRGRAAAPATAAHRAPPRPRRWVMPAAAGALAAAAAALFAILQPAPPPVATDTGVAIVADTSEPALVPPAPFAKGELDTREFAGRGASAAPADDLPAAVTTTPAEPIDAADAEVVALLDVLDPEPRELRGSLARDERNRARWQSMRPDARQALREQWRRFRALTSDEQGAMLRERDPAP